MARHITLLVHGYEMGWSDIRHVLQSIPDVSIVGDVFAAQDAMRVALEYRPDLILASTKLGNGDSVLPTLVALRDDPCPASTIGVFSSSISPRTEFEALAGLGIAGYVVWTDVLYPSLHACLSALLTGDLYVASHTSAEVLAAMLLRRIDPNPPLSVREQRVLGGLAVGLTEKELARRLECNERTVRNLISQMEEKLGASTLFTLGMRATLSGFVP